MQSATADSIYVVWRPGAGIVPEVRFGLSPSRLDRVVRSTGAIVTRVGSGLTLRARLRRSAGLRPNEGTIQVVTGNGGTRNRRRGSMPVMKRVSLDHGSVLVDVAGDRLTAAMVTSTGERQDLFSIIKRGTVTPKRLPNPRQLPAYTRR